MKTYAQILNGVVHWIFTDAEMPEWNPNDINAIDITGKVVNIGDVWNGVTFSAPLPVAQTPNISGFIAAIKQTLGGIVAISGMPHYAAFMDALRMQEWSDVHDLVVDAKTTNMITTAQYAAFQTAFAANNIPVTLP